MSVKSLDTHTHTQIHIFLGHTSGKTPGTVRDVSTSTSPGLRVLVRKTTTSNRTSTSGLKTSLGKKKQSHKNVNSRVLLDDLVCVLDPIYQEPNQHLQFTLVKSHKPRSKGSFCQATLKPHGLTIGSIPDQVIRILYCVTLIRQSPSIPYMGWCTNLSRLDICHLDNLTVYLSVPLFTVKCRITVVLFDDISNF